MSGEGKDWDEDLLSETDNKILEEAFPSNMNDLSMRLINADLETSNIVDELKERAERLENRDLETQYWFLKNYWKMPTEENMEEVKQRIIDKLPEAKRQSKRIEAFKEKALYYSDKARGLKPEDVA